MVMLVSVLKCIDIAPGFFSTLINISGNLSVNKRKNVKCTFTTLLGVWIEFFRNLISRRKILSFYSHVQNPTMSIDVPVSLTLFIWVCNTFDMLSLESKAKQTSV